MTNIVSMTELKNNAASILNEVYFHGKVTLVERYGKPIAEIVPTNKSARDKVDIKKALELTFGSLPDFPDVTKERISRKETIKL